MVKRHGATLCLQNKWANKGGYMKKWQAAGCRGRQAGGQTDKQTEMMALKVNRCLSAALRSVL